MTKVYVVMEHDWEYDQIKAIFTDKEDAFKLLVDKKKTKIWDIHEIELNKYLSDIQYKTLN